jgi:hypothetical protein
MNNSIKFRLLRTKEIFQNNQIPFKIIKTQTKISSSDNHIKF